MNVGIGYKNIKNSKHLALLQEEQAILFEIVAHHLKKQKKKNKGTTLHGQGNREKSVQQQFSWRGDEGNVIVPGKETGF